MTYPIQKVKDSYILKLHSKLYDPVILSKALRGWIGSRASITHYSKDCQIISIKTQKRESALQLANHIFAFNRVNG